MQHQLTPAFPWRGRFVFTGPARRAGTPSSFLLARINAEALPAYGVCTMDGGLSG